MTGCRYWIYILASKSGTLYIGVTNNLERRIWEHKQKMIIGFSQKYGCDKLVYFEEYRGIDEAIAREKQLKRWNRGKKIRLIRSNNPHWLDLLKGIPPLRSG
jgi:putative endonuclease